MPGGSWIVRCMDPQGAAFALQGKRNPDSIGAVPIGWSTEWGGFSSKGRMVTLRGKPRLRIAAVGSAIALNSVELP